MLVFEHNAHQLEQAEQLSAKMGFAKFEINGGHTFTAMNSMVNNAIEKFKANKKEQARTIKLIILKFVGSKEKLPYSEVLKKLGNLESIKSINSKNDISDYTFFVKDMEFSIPVNFDLDTKLEQEKIEKELSYIEGFLKSVRKKLNNKKFTNNAPKKVIENELKKESDAIKKIEILKKNIS